MKLILERLKQTVHYDPDSGHFIRKMAANGRVKIGEEAGSPDINGYIIIKIDRKSYKAHRLAWFYVHEVWPHVLIDHADGNTSNNKIANLRLATGSQNNANSRLYKSNTTGYRGVTFHKPDGKFYAAIRKDRKSRHLGSFDNPKDAHQAYLSAQAVLHGEFAKR